VQIKVFVPMPDEGADASVLAGVRLVPYRCGVAVLAMLDAATRERVAQPATAPRLPASSVDRLP